jgi:curved DNA-binding protein CbpA
MNNCYETLGIERAATHEQIVSAFRKMVLMYHPDRNHSPEAKEKFIRVHEAFEVIGNPERRAIYDAGFIQSQQPYTYAPPAPPPHANHWSVLGWGRGLGPRALFGFFVGLIILITMIAYALGWK